MAAPPKISTLADSTGEEDRAKFKHVFGDVTGLDFNAGIARRSAQ